MAKTASLRVVITGDSKDAQQAFQKTSRAAEDTEKRTRRSWQRMGQAAKTGGLIVGAGLAAGFIKASQAAIEAEKSQARMTTQLRALGISYKSHARQIDEVIQKHAKLSGLDDEDLQDSFTNIIRVTGNVSKSLRLTGLAADFARAKHLDVAKAGEIVGKVAGGNIGILARYGIVIDKGASSSEALAALQRRFAGQSEAYGKTTAGAMDRAKVAVENLGEVVGAKTAPLIAKGANALTRLIDPANELPGPIRTASGALAALGGAIRSVVQWLGRHRTATNVLITAIGAVVTALIAYKVGVLAAAAASRVAAVATNMYRAAVIAVRGALIAARVAAIAFAVGIRLVTLAMRATPIGAVVTVIVALGVALVTAYKRSETFRRVVNGAFAAVKSAATSVARVVRSVVGGAFDVLTGRGSRVARVLQTVLLPQVTAIRFAINHVGDAIRAVVRAFDRMKNIVGGVAGAIKGAAGKLNPFGDGIGRQARSLASPTAGPIGAAAPGGLMGAQPIMGAFAREGSRFGLHVTSGRRPGSITSAGNVSYHSSGEAVDLGNGVGPDESKMMAARYLVGKYGSRLAELIYSPLGFSIKNGKRVAPYAVSDHYDHVHVALDTGRPGVGDGIGQAASAVRRAGFKGLAGVIMTAIAGPESGFKNSARLVTPKEDSRGMWQVNTLAHPWARALNLRDPFVAAAAAMRVYREAGNSFGPWTGYSKGGYRAYLSRARAAFIGSRSGSGTAATRTGRTTPGGMPISDAIEAARGTVARQGGSSIAPATHEQLLANTDLAMAEATATGGSTVGALTMRRNVLNARLFKVTAALGKRNLTPATRLRLTQERASLLGDISSTNTDLFTAAAPVAAEEDTTAGDSFRDALEALKESIDAQTEATKQHGEVLDGLRSEVKAQSALAERLSQVSAHAGMGAVADFVSGQIAGRGIARRYTPGYGVEVRF